MSNSNKPNRKIILAKMHSQAGFNNNNDSGQGSRHEISVVQNVSSSVKRRHGDRTSNPGEQTSAKRPKMTYDLPNCRSPLLSLSSSSVPKSKNIANKRLQDLRKSLEEKRPVVEREINERLNKTISSEILNISDNKNIFNSAITENKITKDVSLSGSSGSSLIQSRLNLHKLSNKSFIQSQLNCHKSSTDLRNNNSTITTSNINQITSELKQTSSHFRFLPANNNSCDKSTNVDDSMEWEPVDEDTVLNNVFWFGSAMFQWSFMAKQLVTDINKIRKEIIYDKRLSIDDVLNNSDPLTESKNGVFVVVDTNIFLSQMNVLVQLRKKEFEDFNRVTIIVPWMVLQELDYMKETKGCHLGKNARKAVSYINEQLILNDPYFKGQTVLEASKQEMGSTNADDGILHCCMQLIADKKFVILLSNDINLRNKVLVNRIQGFSSNDIMGRLNELKLSHFKETNKINIDKIKIILSNLLTHIVESEMRKAYGDIWLKMVKSNPPYTMDEALCMMFKYWVSVFSFSLQKQAHHKIEEFILFSKRHKNADSYSQETYNQFMEHSLTLCVYLKNGYPCYKLLIMESLSNIQKCAE